MILCLDIHTHHAAPAPEAVIAVDPSGFSPMEGQLYSVGIHPWWTDAYNDATEWEALEQTAFLDCVVAIGECGVDLLKGGPLFRQLQVFKRQVELSEKIGKPLVIHDVKAHDIILGLKRDLHPTQNWVIHGFRGKPALAKMFTDAGLWLSFGERFNPDTLRTVDKSRILAETDESSLTIHQIIDSLSECMGEELQNIIAENTVNFLS